MLGTVKRATSDPSQSKTGCQRKEENHMQQQTGTRTSRQLLEPDEPPAKRRRLEAEDLLAFEELDDSLEEDWHESERFKILEGIGRGAYATVYKAIDREGDNAVVAVKKMAFLVEDPKHIIPSHIAREISNLRRLHDNQHIIRLLNVALSEGRYSNELIVDLVFEYMDNDLDRCIRQSQPNGLGENLIKSYLQQILNGVEWMHTNNVIHRDLKPQNILVSKKGLVKIADFGLSRVIDDTIVLSTQVVTQWYRAPEVLLHSSYSKAVDIWSVGCILAEMYIGRPLFATKTNGEIAQLKEIFRVTGTPPYEEWPKETLVVYSQFKQIPSKSWEVIIPSMSQSAVGLLSKMLVFQADNRFTAKETLSDSFLISSVLPSSKTRKAPPLTLLSVSPSPSLYSLSPSPLLSPSQDPAHTPLSTATEDSVDSGIHDI